MKPKHILIILMAVVVFSIFMWLWRQQKSVLSPQPSQAIATAEAKASIGSSARARDEAPVTKPSKKPAGSKIPVSSTVQEYTRNRIADQQYDWKQPINFFGRVVDESDHSVPGAVAHFKWTDLSENGTSESSTESDSAGLFSLLGRKGKRMSVTVAKDGYYTPLSERMSSYEYANPAEALFSPDSSNPIVFHLRKKGPGAALITSHGVMSPDLLMHIPRDGTPVNIDLLTQNIGNTGQVKISELKPEYQSWKLATNWSFRMEIAEGGFLEQNDDFPFEAPTSGYQSVVNFQFQKDGTNWTEGINKKFYIKFGSPARYGRFQVQTTISNGGALITYAINPDGSRNLEPAN